MTTPQQHANAQAAQRAQKQQAGQRQQLRDAERALLGGPYCELAVGSETLCKCGCGATCSPGKQWVGHHANKATGAERRGRKQVLVAPKKAGKRQGTYRGAYAFAEASA